MKGWIDSHFHPQLILDKKSADCGSILSSDDLRLFDACTLEIIQGLMVSIDLSDHQLLKALSHQRPHLQWSVGIHPCHIEESDGLSRMEELRAIINNHDPDAIGETGLDAFHQSDLMIQNHQADFFKTHIECGRDFHKPIIVHTRSAPHETLSILKQYKGTRGVIHCFTESLDFARQVLDLGWMISFSGIVTFPKSIELQAIAQYIPLDSLLIETDAPYLAPVPYRGRPNQPNFVGKTGEFIAQIREIDLSIFQESVWSNYKQFLKINT